MAAGACLVTPALYQSLRRRLVAAEQIALPTREPANQIVVDVFWRAPDQETVFDFFAIFVLSPAVASLAERDFVPLCGLVIVAGLGEFLALPDFAYALFEDVAHVGCPHPIETAQAYAAVVVHRHGLVNNGAGHALGRLDHVGEGAVLEHDAGSHHIDDSDPAIDELVGFVLVGILNGDRNAYTRRFAIAPDAQQSEYRRLDLGELVDAAHFHQRLGSCRIEAEHHRVDADVAEERCNVLRQGQAVGIHCDGDTTSLQIGEDLAQIRDQERLAIDTRRHHRLGIGEFVEHLARRSKLHNALDVVDGIVVLETPNRAHVAAQVAARGIVD